MNFSPRQALGPLLVFTISIWVYVTWQNVSEKRARTLERPALFRKSLRDFVSSSNALDAFDCTPYGWNYTISLAKDDVRANLWWNDVQLVRKNPGMQTFTAHFCGYGVGESLPQANDGDVFIDVGANMGQSLLPYASKGWTVYAFEPTVHNLEILRTNIMRNRFTMVHLLPYAVSNWTGKTRIFVPIGREDNSALAGEAVADLNVKTKRVQTEVVNMTTVDSVLYSIESFQPTKVRRIKIDTQGHEIEVLHGMKRLLASLPDDVEVVLEYSDTLQRAAGHSGKALLSAARFFGFDVYCGVKCIHDGVAPRCLDITLRKSRKAGGKTGTC